MTQFTCAECVKYHHDYNWEKHTGTGRRRMVCNGTVEVLRPPGTPLPCDRCPKESPAKEREHVLTAENWRVWQFYKEVRATGGACLTKKMKKNRLLMRLLSLVDEVTRKVDRLGR